MRLLEHMQHGEKKQQQTVQLFLVIVFLFLLLLISGRGRIVEYDLRPSLLQGNVDVVG